jgi:hypothetical protein
MPIRSLAVPSLAAVATILVAAFAWCGDLVRARVNSDVVLTELILHSRETSTPQERLCAASQIFVAQVLNAALVDNSPTSAHSVHMTLKIDEFMARRDRDPSTSPHRRDPRPGDIIDVESGVYSMSGGGMEVSWARGFLGLGWPIGSDARAPPVLPLSDAEIGDVFIGKRFVFGIRISSSSDQDRLPAIAWPRQSRSWILNSFLHECGHP